MGMDGLRLKWKESYGNGWIKLRNGKKVMGMDGLR